MLYKQYTKCMHNFSYEKYIKTQTHNQEKNKLKYQQLSLSCGILSYFVLIFILFCVFQLH